MSCTKFVADMMKICSVLPVFAVVPALAESINVHQEFDSAVNFDTGIAASGLSGTNGGVLFNAAKGDITIGGTSAFLSNSAQYGGAFFNRGVINFVNGAKSRFDGNRADMYGGAIYNSASGKIYNLDATFANNSVFSTAIVGGGAISNVGYIADVAGLFDHNSVSGACTGADCDDGGTVKGGAIYNYWSDSKIDNIHADFVDNKVFAWGESIGGAITNDGTIGTIIAADKGFVGNAATDANESFAGAVFNSEGAKISDIQANFTDNTVRGNNRALGGAIVNRAETGNVGVIENVSGVFTNNSAALNKDVSEQNDEAFGGAIYNEGEMNISNSEFNENWASMIGGAIFNKGMMSIDTSKFTGNYSLVNYGGAIYNTGSGNISQIVADFEGNYVAAVNAANGGAIANISKIGSVSGDFTGNYVAATGEDGVAKGGAIYAAKTASIDSVHGDFSGNSATGKYNAIGGAITNDGAIGEIISENGFNNNTVRADVLSEYSQADAGALYNSQNAKITKLIADFTNNSATGGQYGLGGAMFNATGGIISEMQSNFANNTVSGAIMSVGGALYNDGTIASLTGNFTDNVVLAGAEDTWYAGGAIYNDVTGVINLVGNNVFSGNRAGGYLNDIYNDGVITISSGETTLGGGIWGEGVLNNNAVLNFGISGATELTDVASLVNNNADAVVNLNGNVLLGNDGYVFNNLGTVNVVSGITTLGSGFVNSGTLANNAILNIDMPVDGMLVNNADGVMNLNGDMLLNTLTNVGELHLASGVFAFGTDFANTGTIYNHSQMDIDHTIGGEIVNLADAIINLNGEMEFAGVQNDGVINVLGGGIALNGDITGGGQIVNDTMLTVKTGVIANALLNNADIDVIGDVKFTEITNNKNITVSDGTTTLSNGIIGTGTLTNNSVLNMKSEFENAIMNNKGATFNVSGDMVLSNVTNDGSLNILDGDVTTGVAFVNNGNIVNDSVLDVLNTIGGTGTLTNNSVLNVNADIANTIVNGGELNTSGIVSMSGITNTGDMNVLSGETSIDGDVLGSGLIANNGVLNTYGVIENAIMNNKGATFNVSGDDIVLDKVSNHGNIVIVDGSSTLGADFDNQGVLANDAVLNMDASVGGEIVNNANGVLNVAGDVVFADLTNNGLVDIHTGTISVDTSVVGKGTFNLGADSVLSLGTSKISQSVFNLDGTVQVSVVNERSYGILDGTINAGDNAILELDVNAVGVYDIFGSNDQITNIEIVVGSLFQATETLDGIVVSTKSLDNLMADTGLSVQTAGAIAGMANADNRTFQRLAVAAQEMLDAGKVEQVESELAKVNPDNKPVSHSVTSAVQNQVLAVVSGRMAGGVTVGRAGGDSVRESGFWVQGLFNKSKYDNQFHGYTRGLALGGDTYINRVLTLGGGFAYNNTDVHAGNGRTTDIDSKTLFAYMQYQPNKWYVNTTLTYGMSEYTERTTVFGHAVAGTYGVDSYGAQLMTGYDFASGVTLEMGGRYLHIAQDKYNNGVATIDATDTNFLTGVAGLKYSFAIENDGALKLFPELRVAATYDFISDDSLATVMMPGVDAYQVSGNGLSEFGGEFGIGLTAKYRGVELSVMYDLDLHQDYTSQTGMFKFRGRF